MGFDDIVNKGKAFVSDKANQQELKGAYEAFNKQEGSTLDKAKAAYLEFESGSKSSATDAKDEAKTEAKTETKTEAKK